MIQLSREDLYRMYKKDTGESPDNYLTIDYGDDENQIEFDLSSNGYLKWLEDKYLSVLNEKKETQEFIKKANEEALKIAYDEQ